MHGNGAVPEPGTGLCRSQARSEERQEPGNPETPASLLALPEVFCMTLGKPFNMHSVSVSLQTERGDD